MIEGEEVEGEDCPNEEKETHGREGDDEGRVGNALLRQVSGLDTNLAKFSIAVFFF